MKGRLLPEVLSERAAAEPARRAYVFLTEDGAEKDSLTYGQLHARALTVAGVLRSRCRPGERALLVFPPGLDFLAAYFGCLYAGVVAVPVNPPRRGRVRDATFGIVRDCEPVAVLTTAAMAAGLRPVLDGPLWWLCVDDLPGAGPPLEPWPCTAGSPAFLQYTSGSTSAPKGVQVSHGNLAANQEMIRLAFGHDRHSTVVGWAPLFHDQGLIGNVLQPLYVGATSILMSPMAFIRRPLLWLSTISRYRAHTSGGPNFAFEACVEHAARANSAGELDLSSWAVAFNGAEPIRPDTLRRFAETFAPFGFSSSAWYPCYGLAEATLIVTGSRPGRGARTLDVNTEALGHQRYAPGGRRLAGSGFAVPGEQVRIVDPDTRVPCGDGHVGEIWVHGPNVAKGYWRRPEATAATFHAECAGEPGRTYLRTGDLGMIVDGELYVVGRRKDLVIIRGRNYYPQDIELTAESAHPSLRPGGCAAFSVPRDGEERLVVVQEIRREYRRNADPAEVAAAVRAAVAREHDVSLAELVLTLPGRLRKTSSGKIMRADARERFLASGFEAWTPDMERTERNEHADTGQSGL
ncbi:acyl-CoA synthetase (AMP-forming)/AMP-acid ligase II [Saccharomonospora amisosensis]|uniref:Acyl-CoA synthetase (AMP-forming)/AMP-acid ligase II n=1 Tax=Saccharomonospora amisosensis TaxID=1128677 RepID=A0A7X5UQ85_9PSEU|nr:fatty acyl-AMP ligase [Saccharomonospora amisosensis]NIJ11887.1 acyl-CoA synthetase (AMP-forming)/AMP-acid ligase II [Saccharomonospora amisosensis]